MTGAITRLAIPLVAIGTLAAGPAEMGTLGAAGNAAFLLFGLLAGVIADRIPRRRIVIVTTFIPAVALATIPLATALGTLRLELLYAVAFVTGASGVVGEVAFQSLLPRLVGRERLLAGNALMRSLGSVTEVVGPSMAGVIIQVLTAPVAIVIDVAATLVETLLTFLVRVKEPPARPRTQHIGRDIMDGLRYVVSDPSLRAIAAGGATHNIFSNGALVALYILYASTVLRLTPAEIGVAFAFGGPGAFVGSVFAARYGRRFGMRATLVQAQIATGVARLLVPLSAFVAVPIVTFAAGELLLGVARAIFNVNQLSLRQAMTPDEMQGRMSASIRFLMWAVVPFGALAGGFGAERIGLQATMTVAAIGTTLAAGWFVLLPAREEEPAAAR